MRQLAVIIIVLHSFSLFSQPIIDSIYNTDIHSIQIYKKGWELSYPIMQLNSEEKLVIGFDDFATDQKNYCYTIVHCNSNWEPENISFSEYADGFIQNQIQSVVFSSSTVVGYIHYSFEIPNESCEPIISGNYIVKVFEDFDDSKIVFTRKFYITEQLAMTNFSVIRPDIPKYMLKYQEYTLSIQPNLIDYFDLRSEIKVLVMQNYGPASIKTCYLTRIDEGNMMYYENPDSNIFEGYNEFRNFDTKSIKYQSPRIKSISFNGNVYNIELFNDEWRNRKQYFTDNDINGNYYIANNLGVRKERDADYFQVHFYLSTQEPLVDGNIYVYGALTDWTCNSGSLMKYNLENHCYELSLMLKQGYYNYLYAYKPFDTGRIDLSYVEGRHYETENDYLLFVYYKSVASRYERLIGFNQANSIKK